MWSEILDVLVFVDKRIVVWSGGIWGRNYVFWEVGCLFWKGNFKWCFNNGEGVNLLGFVLNVIFGEIRDFGFYFGVFERFC